MTESKERNKNKHRTKGIKRRNRNLRFFIFISIILIICFILFFKDFFKQEELIKTYIKENKKKTEEIQELEEEIEDLKTDLERVNSDEFIEQMARERLGMIKEDEKVILDPEDDE